MHEFCLLSFLCSHCFIFLFVFLFLFLGGEVWLPNIHHIAENETICILNRSHKVAQREDFPLPFKKIRWPKWQFLVLREEMLVITRKKNCTHQRSLVKYPWRVFLKNSQITSKRAACFHYLPGQECVSLVTAKTRGNKA